MSEHGKTSTYTGGCRCEPCRAAKAAYQRELRGRGKARRDTTAASGRYIARGITHGLYGYTMHCCRCFTCSTAKAESMARWRAGKAAS